MKKISLWSLIVILLLFIFNPFSKAEAKSYSTDKELLILSTIAYQSSEKSTVYSEIDNAMKNKKLLISTSEAKKMKSKWVKIYFKAEYGVNSSAKLSQKGFASTAYYNKSTNEIVVAYRGSNEISDFTKDNTNSYFKDQNFQGQLASGFLNLVLSKAKNGDFKKYGVNYKTIKVSITGHSLGGFLAQKAGVDLLSSNGKSTDVINKGNKNHLVRVLTFNALGMGNPSKLSKAQQKNYLTTQQWSNNQKKLYHKKIFNYTIEGEILDTLNKLNGKVKLGTTKYFKVEKRASNTPATKHGIKTFYTVIK